MKKVKKRTGARSSKKAKRRQYDLSKGIDTRTAPSHQQLLSVMESLDAETETVIVAEMIHLRVTTLNINGLDKMKLDVVAWYAATTKSDIMYLVDTQLLQKENDYMKKLFEEKLQKYSGERWKVLYNAAGPANATVKQRTGGQMCLVRACHESRLHNVKCDKSGLGCLMALELVVNEQPVLSINGYWPVKPSQGGGMGLWSKIQSWMDKQAMHGNPLTYIQELAARWIAQHTLKHGGKNCILFSGDLNSTLTSNETGGSLPSYVNWAKDVGLTDIVGAHAAAHSVDMRTYWRGDWPISSIDHILINKSVGSVAKYGVSNSAIWTGVTDHRPLWVEIHLEGGVMRKVVKAKVTSVKQASIGVSKDEHLEEYQKRMEEFCRSLSQPLNEEEVGL